MVVAMNAPACKLAKAAWHVMRGKDFDEAILFGRSAWGCCEPESGLDENQGTDWHPGTAGLLTRGQ